MQAVAIKRHPAASNHYFLSLPHEDREAFAFLFRLSSTSLILSCWFALCARGILVTRSVAVPSLRLLSLTQKETLKVSSLSSSHRSGSNEAWTACTTQSGRLDIHLEHRGFWPNLPLLGRIPSIIPAETRRSFSLLSLTSGLPCWSSSRDCLSSLACVSTVDGSLSSA